jgi:hypothetical protein
LPLETAKFVSVSIVDLDGACDRLFKESHQEDKRISDLKNHAIAKLLEWLDTTVGKLKAPEESDTWGFFKQARDANVGVQFAEKGNDKIINE